MSNLSISINLEQELEKANAEYNKRKEEVIAKARQMIEDGVICYPESVHIIKELINLLEEKF